MRRTDLGFRSASHTVDPAARGPPGSWSGFHVDTRPFQYASRIHGAQPLTFPHFVIRYDRPIVIW